MDNVYEIIVFDDGNQIYEMYHNEWSIVNTMRDGGKVKLQNGKDPHITINSISSWKILKK
tara:strand:+ start:284 stop:463 length:180 start_codon:yes stop_codon:yes gene_type:complete